ncbi:protein RKD1 [Artemisia annua]|uniref:Protein RKD1 n=1 Tax=Artemisia annua TaxID=35608 RepID=A0A2U1PF14_ARTAN|nr:protein RKD1 [Artemisia annua]
MEFEFQASNLNIDFDLSHITREMITQHFYMAVDQAAKKLGVGLSSLKRQCRAMGIKRWPSRKLNSLQELTKHFQDENAGEKSDPNTQEIIRRLEVLKRQIIHTTNYSNYEEMDNSHGYDYECNEES